VVAGGVVRSARLSIARDGSSVFGLLWCMWQALACGGVIAAGAADCARSFGIGWSGNGYV